MAATALGMYTEAPRGDARGGAGSGGCACAAGGGGARAVRGGGVIGGYLGESGASTACEGWPTCNGGILPGADDQQITHMTHRYLAALLVAPLAWMALAAWRVREVLGWGAPIAFAAAVIYATQVPWGRSTWSTHSPTGSP